MNFWERNNFNSQTTDANRSGGGSSQATEQDVRQKFEEYSSKSEEQLMSELSSLAARMKREGTFDAAVMENLYNTASPFLNEAQRQRMRQLINMLVD